MSRVGPNDSNLSPITAPLVVDSINCDTCPVGCSSDFHPIEICPLIPRDYPTGARLATQGEPTRYVWFVKRGAVAGTWGAGRETNVLFGPGSIVGVEGLVSETHCLTAWTLARTTLCSFERLSFLKWLERRGELADKLAKNAHEIVAAAMQHRKGNEK